MSAEAVAAETAAAAAEGVGKGIEEELVSFEVKCEVVDGLR